MLKNGTIIKHDKFGVGMVLEKTRQGYLIYFPQEKIIKTLTSYIMEMDITSYCHDLSIDEVIKSNVYEGSFNEQIKIRGSKYYREGRVSVLNNTDKHIECEVMGSQNYLVDLNFKDSVLSMKCNCPYGSNCKHIYAAFLTLKNYAQKVNTSEEMKIINEALSNIYSTNYYRGILKLIKFIKDKEKLLKVLDIFDELLSFTEKEYREFINVILLNKKVDSLIKEININNLKENIGFYLVKNKDIIVDTVLRNDMKYISYLLVNSEFESLNIFFNNHRTRYRSSECFLSALIMEDMINDEVMDDFICLIDNHFKSYVSSFFSNVINNELKKRMIIEFDVSVKKNDLIDFSKDELISFFKNYSYSNAYTLYKYFKSNFVDIDDLDKMHMLYLIYYATDYSKRNDVIKEIQSIEGSEYIIEYLENNRYEGGNYGRFYW